MKIAVICWCLLSIALALPIHREKHGSKQEIKGAEVNSVQLGKEAEAGKEKTEKEQSPPGESDKTKEEKEHSPPAESDKPKGEKGHSSELQSDKAKEGKTEIHNDDLETEYQATEEDGVSSDESEKIDKQEDAKPMVQAKGAEAVKEKSDKNAEVNSDNQDKEVEAEKKKMDHLSSAVNDKMGAEKDHPSPAGNGKPKDDKVSGDKPSSKSTRSLKTLDTENMSKYVREVSPRSIVFDMRGVDQEAQDAENSPTAKLEAAADDSQVSLSSDMTDDDQEGAENYLTVKLKAPEEDSQNSPASDVTETDQESAPSSAEAEENTEPQVSGESKPSADDPGNFMDSVEPEVSSAED